MGLKYADPGRAKSLALLPPYALRPCPSIINKFGAQSEAEVLTGCVRKQVGTHRRKRMDLRQQVGVTCAAGGGGVNPWDYEGGDDSRGEMKGR